MTSLTSRLPQSSGSKLLPKPSTKNSIQLTIYSILIGALFFLLSSKSSPIDEKTLDYLSEHATTSPDWQLLVMAGLFIIFILAGVIVIMIYALMMNHRAKLTKPRINFNTFYFTFILWLAFLATLELLLRILALTLGLSLDTLPALLISILLTILINVSALVLMHQYLSQQKYFFPWLKRLLLPKKNKSSIRSLILWGTIAYIGFVPIILAGSLINQLILDWTGRYFQPQEIIEFSLENQNLFISILLFLLVTILAPFFEEIIMRGLIFRGLLKKYAPFSAMILSGLIFALFHFNVFAFLPIALIGTLFAWLYWRTGSLIPSMIAHALFNGINFLLLEVLKVG